MTPLICKCCGGQINPTTMKCKYCDTVYGFVQLQKQETETRDMPRIITSEPVTITAYNTDGRKICDFETITEESAIMTPNEVRKKIGLNPIADFGISVEEATQRFLDLGRCCYKTCHHN